MRDRLWIYSATLEADRVYRRGVNTAATTTANAQIRPTVLELAFRLGSTETVAGTIFNHIDQTTSEFIINRLQFDEPTLQLE